MPARAQPCCDLMCARAICGRGPWCCAGWLCVSCAFSCPPPPLGLCFHLTFPVFAGGGLVQHETSPTPPGCLPPIPCPPLSLPLLLPCCDMCACAPLLLVCFWLALPSLCARPVSPWRVLLHAFGALPDTGLVPADTCAPLRFCPGAGWAGACFVVGALDGRMPWGGNGLGLPRNFPPLAVLPSAVWGLGKQSLHCRRRQWD